VDFVSEFSSLSLDKIFQKAMLSPFRVKNALIRKLLSEKKWIEDLIKIVFEYSGTPINANVLVLKSIHFEEERCVFIQITKIKKITRQNYTSYTLKGILVDKVESEWFEVRYPVKWSRSVVPDFQKIRSKDKEKRVRIVVHENGNILCPGKLKNISLWGGWSWYQDDNEYEEKEYYGGID
jgi:hypothetical protein